MDTFGQPTSIDENLGSAVTDVNQFEMNFPLPLLQMDDLDEFPLPILTQSSVSFPSSSFDENFREVQTKEIISFKESKDKCTKEKISLPPQTVKLNETYNKNKKTSNSCKVLPLVENRDKASEKISIHKNKAPVQLIEPISILQEKVEKKIIDSGKIISSSQAFKSNELNPTFLKTNNVNEGTREIDVLDRSCNNETPIPLIDPNLILQDTYMRNSIEAKKSKLLSYTSKAHDVNTSSKTTSNAIIVPRKPDVNIGSIKNSASITLINPNIIRQEKGIESDKSKMYTTLHGNVPSNTTRHDSKRILNEHHLVRAAGSTQDTNQNKKQKLENQSFRDATLTTKNLHVNRNSKNLLQFNSLAPRQIAPPRYDALVNQISHFPQNLGNSSYQNRISTFSTQIIHTHSNYLIDQSLHGQPSAHNLKLNSPQGTSILNNSRLRDAPLTTKNLHVNQNSKNLLQFNSLAPRQIAPPRYDALVNQISHFPQNLGNSSYQNRISTFSTQIVHTHSNYLIDQSLHGQPSAHNLKLNSPRGYDPLMNFLPSNSKNSVPKPNQTEISGNTLQNSSTTKISGKYRQVFITVDSQKLPLFSNGIFCYVNLGTNIIANKKFLGNTLQNGNTSKISGKYRQVFITVDSQKLPLFSNGIILGINFGTKIVAKKETAFTDVQKEKFGPATILSQCAATDFPSGWTVQTRQRNAGLSKGTTDKYWFSPILKKKFRSRVEVQTFLSILHSSANGNEETAFQYFKNAKTLNRKQNKT